MNVYTIVLERLSTGENAVSFLTRHQETEEAARAYADAAIAHDLDLRVVEIRVRGRSVAAALASVGSRWYGCAGVAAAGPATISAAA